jgi:hypothetical protein
MIHLSHFISSEAELSKKHITESLIWIIFFLIILNSYLIENRSLYTLFIRSGGNRQDLSGQPGQIEIPPLLR